MAKKVKADAVLEVRDRIIGLIEVTSDQVRDHPHQWRLHPESQMAALRDVLGSIGQANVLVVYRSDGYFPGELVAIDGHGRKNDSGITKWKAIELDVSDAEADVLLATIDPIAGMAQTNKERFQALYDALPVQREATQMMLDDIYGARLPDRNLAFAVPVGDNSVEPNEGIANIAPNPMQGLTMGVPASAVRMVQLYLSNESHPILMGWVDSLADALDTANITETIMAAVKFAYEVVVESVAPSDLLSELREAHEEPPFNAEQFNADMEALGIIKHDGPDEHPEALPQAESVGASVAARLLAEDEEDVRTAVHGLAAMEGDIAYVCTACNIAWEKEDADLGDGRCPVCGADLDERSVSDLKEAKAS